jgi:hypothetical protein
LKRHLFLLLILAWVPALAQKKQTGADSLRKRGYSTKIFAVPTLGNSPETGFYAGAVGLLDFVPRWDSLARHSNFKAELTYTFNRQFLAQTEHIFTDSAQRYIILGKNAWLKFPELYWGKKGYQPAFQAWLYDANRIELFNAILFRIRKGMYLGPVQQFQQIHIKSTDRRESEIEAFAELKNNRSSGLGVNALYDTRTNLLNPRPGERYFQIQALTFGSVLGSQTRFQSLDLDFRSYFKWTAKTRIAVQALGLFRSEGVPFRLMAMSGGPMMLRGFYFGRTRDQHLVSAQAEIRKQFHKWFGFTAFVASGIGFGSVTTPLNSVGAGLRIKVDPKENTNMRFDFAWTDRGDFGFYVAFGEAF